MLLQIRQEYQAKMMVFGVDADYEGVAEMKNTENLIEKGYMCLVKQLSQSGSRSAPD